MVYVGYNAKVADEREFGHAAAPSRAAPPLQAWRKGGSGHCERGWTFEACNGNEPFFLNDSVHNVRLQLRFWAMASVGQALTLALSRPIPPSISNPSGMALSSRSLANALMDMDFHIRETAARQDPILRSIAMRPFLVCGMARRD